MPTGYLMPVRDLWVTAVFGGGAATPGSAEVEAGGTVPMPALRTPPPEERWPAL